MNKILFLIATFVFQVSAYNTRADNSNIIFSGEIVQSSCKIIDNNHNTVHTKEVYLGNYPTTSFPTIGSTSGDKAFSISLEKCELANYTLRFDGNTLPGHPDLLVVTGGADGVGVEILNNKGKVLPISQEITDLTQVTVTNGIEKSDTTIVNLRARYKSYQNQITAGQANSNATFTITYK